MPETVPVTLELDPKTPAAPGDPTTRARVERLFAAMDALSAEARRRGLTDEIPEAELAAHNAERRER